MEFNILYLIIIIPTILDIILNLILIAVRQGQYDGTFQQMKYQVFYYYFFLLSMYY